MNDTQILVYALLIIVVCALIGAIWIGSIFLQEANSIKEHASNVKSAFSAVNVEISRKLKDNNAIAYADLASIVKRIANLFPGTNITLKKEFERKQVTIIVEAGEFSASYTILATIVEYGYRPGNKE